MTTGTVKWFNLQKGFGFIQRDDGGNDAFVHISAVERSGLGDLREGQLGRRRGGGGITLEGQSALQRPADRFLVIDDQDVFQVRRGSGPSQDSTTALGGY